MSNFLIQLMNKSYSILTFGSIQFIIDFLAKQDDLFKLIEIVCLGFTSPLRKIEEEYSLCAFQQLL